MVEKLPPHHGDLFQSTEQQHDTTHTHTHTHTHTKEDGFMCSLNFTATAVMTNILNNTVLLLRYPFSVAIRSGKEGHLSYGSGINCVQLPVLAVLFTMKTSVSRRMR